MAISLCIKGREEMTEKIIIKPSVQKRFDSFMVHGRVLFFSAPCGFGKTVLADALLRGRNVLRQSAADPDCAIPPSAQDWDILLIDDLQLMQEEAGQQALCELIRSSPERRFVLLSRGVPPGCLTAFQYTGLMTVLEADDLLFDADDVRRLFQLSGANVTDNEIDGILKESLGYPLGVAITRGACPRTSRGRRSWWRGCSTRCSSTLRPLFTGALTCRCGASCWSWPPLKVLTWKWRGCQRRSPRRRTAGLASSIHHYAALRRLPALPLLVGFPGFSPLGDGTGVYRGKAQSAHQPGRAVL